MRLGFAGNATASQTFAWMVPVHVGMVLRELYLELGYSMQRFRSAVSFSEKTIYYHFKQENLSTKTLASYEAGLKKLGVDVDIWKLMSDKRHGVPVRTAMGLPPLPVPVTHPAGESDPHDLSEPEVQYKPRPVQEEQPSIDEMVADLMRQAADLLAKKAHADPKKGS